MAFTNEKGWIEASQWVSAAWNRGDSYALCLQKWCCIYMSDLTTLPRNIYGTWKSSILLMDEDLRDDIQTRLHGIRPYIAAMDIVQFLSTPEMKMQLSNKPISLCTAQRWLCIMGYHWQKEWKGQYSDSHEHEDSMWKWDDEGNEEVPALPPEQWTIVWFHNESIFYAHDHPKVHWVHNSKSAKPYAKGDGASLMVANFPGKNCDGYFSNEEVLQQATQAMDVLCQKYPNERHVFIFDNARTHAKRAEDTLSALHMPRNPKHWGITGMVQILKEHGHLNVNSFICWSIANNSCCCQNILFCSDDFINIPCLLMTHCQARGFNVLFLPNFHCELNFIEQVWGYAKREYREAPPSSRIEDVEKNSKAALDMVSILSMQWFSNWSLQYMDGYQRGLDGREAAWATRKYHGHCQMPADATQEMIWEWMASKSAQ
ncbi:hypothetical protein BS47DRAFT_1373802 [Hydnum rufescens UP504]|uniref:Tc1-like transposase DDE domain-containing protein n=1 Tax=Hydnum rufescens UP504 TaxID=1448309 RepID=A0A9P6ALB5_9AGAM|nr:hypothetical protein BS47DRAFT_1373802 [Hydnum rufescens UP504]